MLNADIFIEKLVSAGLNRKVAVVLGDTILEEQRERVLLIKDLDFLKETTAKKVDVVKLESDLVTKEFFEQKMEASNDKFERKFDELNDKFERKFDELKMLIAADHKSTQALIAAEHRSTLRWVVGIFAAVVVLILGPYFK